MNRKFLGIILISCVLLGTIFSGGAIMADNGPSVHPGHATNQNSTSGNSTSDNSTSDNSTSDNSTLDYACLMQIMNRIQELEEELVAAGDNTSVDVTPIMERLMLSTYNRLEVLCRIYGNAPENARHGIENAIRNTFSKYEGVIERLQNEAANHRFMNGHTEDSSRGQQNKYEHQHQHENNSGDNNGNHGNK